MRKHIAMLTPLIHRAAFVLAKEKANSDDTNVTVSGAGIGHDAAWAKQSVEEVIYLDKTASMGTVFPGYCTAEIYQGNNAGGLSAYTYAQINNIKQIQFGSLMNDILTGGKRINLQNRMLWRESTNDQPIRKVA
jgi:hypothetical protein